MLGCFLGLRVTKSAVGEPPNVNVTGNVVTRQRRLSDTLSPAVICDFGEVLDKGQEQGVISFLTLNFELDPRHVLFSDGKSPLTRVVANCPANLEMLRLLLHRYGVDIDATDRTEEQKTALHGAIAHKDRTAVAILLLEGAHPDQRTGTAGHCSPLHWCASRGFVEGARLLLANDADITAKDSAGLTPLDWSVYHNEVEMTKFLRAYMKEHDIQDETKEG